MSSPAARFCAVRVERWVRQTRPVATLDWGNSVGSQGLNSVPTRREKLDVITFEIGDITIQLVNGQVLFWTGGTDHEPDVVVEIERLQDALSAARMLRKHNAER
jgi:hypothetical protein